MQRPHRRHMFLRKIIDGNDGIIETDLSQNVQPSFGFLYTATEVKIVIISKRYAITGKTNRNVRCNRAPTTFTLEPFIAFFQGCNIGEVTR